MLALDTETTGLFYYKHKIFGIAHSFSKEECGFSSWTPEKIEEIKKVCSGSEAVVGHNIKFDLHMMMNYGVPIPSTIHDTAVMASLLNENKSKHLADVAHNFLGMPKWKDEVKQYVKKHSCTYDKVPAEVMSAYSTMDAVATRELGEALLPQIEAEGLMDLYNQEMTLVRSLITMERTGVQIDLSLLETVRTDLVKQEEELMPKIYEEAGHEFDILSEDQLGKVLFKELHLPTQGKTVKTGKLKVDDVALNKLDHPIAQYVLSYRKVQKLRATYCDNIRDHLDENSVLHCSYWQYGTATGRLSCREPNLQNIPKESRIRELFVPRPGTIWVYWDYSQQEMRLYSGFSCDTAMKEVFARGEDIYVYMAKIFYSKTDIVKAERDYVKSLALAILYGIGVSGIMKRYKVDRDEAGRIRTQFHTAFPKMKRFMYYIQDRIKDNGFIRNPYGRKRRLERDKAYKGMNSLIQGSGGDIMKDKLNQVTKYLQGKKTRLILTIHDDLTCEVHKDELELIPEITRIMEDVPRATVPLPVKVEYSDKNWKEKKLWKGDIE
jgi:DNA polymerase-1